MRDASKNRKPRLVNFKADHGLLTAIRHGARKLDLDQSKLIRSAVREKLARHGVNVPQN